jgi:parallel beta-helix repeat protein
MVPAEYQFFMKDIALKRELSSVVLHAVAFLLCLHALWLMALSTNAAYAADLDLSYYTTTDNSGKHIIHLPAGTYRISRTIALSSNTILEGEGAATVLRAAPDFRGTQFITNQDPRYGNANITLRSFRAEIVMPVMPRGEAPGILRFENVENLEIDTLVLLVDSPMYAVDLSTRIRNASVKRCDIKNQGSGGGLMIRNRDARPDKLTSGVAVRNNRIESFQDEPLAAFGWEGAVEEVSIENNTVEAHNASFGICAYGIDSKKHRGTIRSVRIAANRVKGSRIGGIAVKGGARSIDIIGNTIEDTKGDGIFLHSGGEGLPGVQDINIRQNTIRRAGRHCIFAAGTNVRVEGNAVNNCSQSGIYAAGDVTVSDNDIANAKAGILVDGGSRNSIKGNHLQNSGQVLFLNSFNANNPEVAVRQTAI